MRWGIAIIALGLLPRLAHAKREYVAVYIVSKKTGKCTSMIKVSKPFRGFVGKNSAYKQAKAACLVEADKRSCSIQQFSLTPDGKAPPAVIAVVKSSTRCYDGGKRQSFGIGAGPNAAAANADALKDLARRNWSWNRKKHPVQQVSQYQIGSPTQPKTALPLRRDCDKSNRKKVAKAALPYAKLAKAVYDCEADKCAVPKGWKKATRWDKLWDKTGYTKPTGWSSSGKGFNAAVYESDTEMVLAFEGTFLFSLADWKANLRNWAGLPAAQYQMARVLAKYVAKNANGKKLKIVGHSLGGNLTQAASAVTGIEAITFNAATPRRGVVAGKVSNIYVEGEVLDVARGLGLMGKYAGHKCALKPKCRKYYGKTGVRKDCGSAVGLHLMDAVIKQLERAAQ